MGMYLQFGSYWVICEFPSWLQWGKLDVLNNHVIHLIIMIHLAAFQEQKFCSHCVCKLRTTCNSLELDIKYYMLFSMANIIKHLYMKDYVHAILEKQKQPSISSFIAITIKRFPKVPYSINPLTIPKKKQNKTIIISPQP